MISKPLFKISKFSGMTDEGGSYYLDGFSPEIENGNYSLDENFFTNETLNSSTANYTSFKCVALTSVNPLFGSGIVETFGYKLMMSDAGLFYTYGTLNSVYRGKIGGSASTGTYQSTDKPDVYQFPSGNILWTGKLHAGVMYRGLMKSSSSTTKIVDSAGRNFSTLGLSTSAPNNKVTNLKTGSEYTITTISTTDATNDTLEFTTSGQNNSLNDEFVAFVYTKFNLNTGITIPTYQGQPYEQEHWSRPIQQYGDQYMIMNGNYIALIANDETTLDATYKQLPVTMQGIDLKVNGNQILISAMDSRGQSWLLLWDGHSDGWNEITPIDKAPNSLKPYDFGWVYLADGVIYYTDGRTVKKLIATPDYLSSNRGGNTYSHNGIAIMNDIFYIAYNPTTNGVNRENNSIMVFNKKTGLTFFKCKSLATEYAQPYCIYSFPERREFSIGAGEALNTLSFFTANSSQNNYRTFVLFLDLGQETKVSEIWLNTKFCSKVYYDQSVSYTGDISLFVGNGKKGIITKGQIASNTTTTCANTAGATIPATVGQEIEFVSGDTAGQRTVIQSIASGGTSSEVWTISPALSTTSSDVSNYRAWQVRYSGQKTITASDLEKPIRFQTNFLGSKMYLKIVVRGSSTAMPLSIHDIMLF